MTHPRILRAAASTHRTSEADIKAHCEKLGIEYIGQRILERGTYEIALKFSVKRVGIPSGFRFFNTWKKIPWFHTVIKESASM